MEKKVYMSIINTLNSYIVELYKKFMAIQKIGQICYNKK